MTSPQPNTVIHPRIVTPGIENQNRENQVPEPGMWCRPDWIRFVGPELLVKEAKRLLRSWFGYSTGSNHGAKFFGHGTLWHPGVMLSEDHPSEIIMIDLQGSRLAIMEVEESLELARAISELGFCCTRIDLAVDHVMQDVNLYERAVASCNSGELCIMRSYAPDPAFRADGTPIRKLLKLGQRESEVCARIYDKGLETKTLPAGLWERFEVEIKGSRAPSVCMSLLKAGEEFSSQLWAYVIGSVDFREKNGRSELNRRPSASWWAQYVGQSLPVRTKPIPMESNFLSWCRWFRKSAGRRLLQLADALGMPPEELFDYLIRELAPSQTVVPAVVEAAVMGENGLNPFNGNALL